MLGRRRAQRLARVERPAERDRTRGADAPGHAVHDVAERDLAGRVAPTERAAHSGVPERLRVRREHVCAFLHEPLRPADRLLQDGVALRPRLARVDRLRACSRAGTRAPRSAPPTRTAGTRARGRARSPSPTPTRAPRAGRAPRCTPRSRRPRGLLNARRRSEPPRSERAHDAGLGRAAAERVPREAEDALMRCGRVEARDARVLRIGRAESRVGAERLEQLPPEKRPDRLAGDASGKARSRRARTSGRGTPAASPAPMRDAAPRARAGPRRPDCSACSRRA